MVCKKETVLYTEKILREHITNSDTVFVFPTKVAADSWAERMLNFVPAIAMERFIAWDTFKGDAIRSTQQDKRSIPSVMRKIFAQYLIVRNAKFTANGKPLFKSIINPNFAEDSLSFSSWIASLLAPLGSWKKTFDKAVALGRIAADDADMDFVVLHDEYKKFLDSHQLFDPAWEEPPFKNNGLEYVIFYPEILSDFSEYEKLLRSSSHVKIISVDSSACLAEEGSHENIDCTLYTNSRTELRQMALFIRQLVAEKKCGYDEIVISIPDMENWGVYVMRELELYCIPALLRSGKGLSSYGAGGFFSLVQQCVNTNFSFDSIKELLSNRYLPWKDESASKLLIRFGIENSCVCSYNSKDGVVDVWQEAFSARAGSYREMQLYSALKKHCTALCRANSFEKIQSAYFQFKQAFFDESEFSEESNLVLGRCLAELANLIDMENSFSDVPVQNHFSFFVSVLDEKEYLPQEKKCGVSVVPYRLAAASPAYCHIIPGASQEHLTVLFKQLSFLSQTKRSNLSLLDKDPSAAFLELYRRHSYGQVRFSCSEKSFSGYSIPHSLLNVTKENNALPIRLEECHPQDFFVAEALSLAKGDSGTDLDKTNYTIVQKEGFENWLAGALVPKQSFTKPDFDVSSCKEQIRKAVAYQGDESKIRISQTAMADYFDCPRMWLFKRVLKLKEPAVQAVLMQDSWIGTIYHNIISKYLGKYMKDSLPIESPEKDSFGMDFLRKENKERLCMHVRTVLEDYKASPLTKQLLFVQEKNILSAAEQFLIKFSQAFAGFSVVALEKEFFCLPDFAREKETVFYNGIIDCVLSCATGEVIIIDFKTGSVPKKEDYLPDENGRLKDFQMPMYVTLWEKNNKEIAVTGAAFMSIKNKKIVPVLGSFGPRLKGLSRHGPEDEQTFDKVLFSFNSMAHEYAQSIENMNFVQVKDVFYSACIKCPWNGVCRTTYSVSGEAL